MVVLNGDIDICCYWVTTVSEVAEVGLSIPHPQIQIGVKGPMFISHLESFIFRMFCSVYGARNIVSSALYSVGHMVHDTM